MKCCKVLLDIFNLTSRVLASCQKRFSWLQVPMEPAWLKTFDKRIDELKSKRDRCLRKSKRLPVLDQQGKETGKEYYLPSKKWEKYNRSLKKAERKRREQTKTFMYTTAHSLYKEYDCVAIGFLRYKFSALGRRRSRNLAIFGGLVHFLGQSSLLPSSTFAP
jgi:hypothetical protein